MSIIHAHDHRATAAHVRLSVPGASMCRMEKVSWRQVAAWRLRRQLLAEPSPDLLATASRVLGLHAQLASAAELIAGARTPSYALGDIDAALWRDRTLVRAWGMRGTLHLFPSDELPLYVAAFRQRQWPKIPPSWEKHHGISGDDLRRITAAIGEILPGQVLTREELGAQIVRQVKAPGLEQAVRSGWGQVFKPAAAGGLLCSGPNRGRNVTFTAPRTWVPDAPWHEQPDEHTAMAAVIARFLDAYGPATHVDFSRWWGTDPAAARRLFAAHADVMVKVEFEGTPAWLTPTGAQAVASAAPDEAAGGWLLPGFDPYVIGPLSHRDHAIPGGFVGRVSRAAGWISPVLVVNGDVRGVWQHELSGGRLSIVIEPFASIPAAAKRAAAASAARYGELFGADVELRWAPPSR